MLSPTAVSAPPSLDPLLQPHHSTFLLSLTALAQDTLDSHRTNITNVHEVWLNGFLETCQMAGKRRAKGSTRGARQPMTELLKTPGRSRVASSTNPPPSLSRSTSALPKDPIATLLFPTANGSHMPLSRSQNSLRDKENEMEVDESVLRSPLKKSSSRLPMASAGSPMRDVVRSPKVTGGSKGHSSSTVNKRGVIHVDVPAPKSPSKATKATNEEMQVDLNISVTVKSPPPPAPQSFIREVTMDFESPTKATTTAPASISKGPKTLTSISFNDELESEVDLDLLQLVSDSNALENDLEMEDENESEGGAVEREVGQQGEEDAVANLSMIGEEEEDNSMEVEVGTKPARLSHSKVTTDIEPPQSQHTSSSLILPETQFATHDLSFPMPTPPPSASLTKPTLATDIEPMPASIYTLAPAPVQVAPVVAPLSPRTSATSSTAAEADASSDDEDDDDMAVPLNDDPTIFRTTSSTLSNHRASAPVAPSTTRTPGGTTSTLRYGAGSYSANRPGLSGINISSPPPMIIGSQPFRPSTVGGGGAKLNFVGLPKKSFPMALGLNRSLAGVGVPKASSSFVAGGDDKDSQDSVTSTFGGSSQANSSIAGAAGAGTKRKSLDTTEGPSQKIFKAKEEVIGAGNTTRVGELKARLQNLRKSSMNTTGPGMGLPLLTKFNPSQTTRTQLSASTSTASISIMNHPPPPPLPLSPKLASAAATFAPRPVSPPRPTSPRLPTSPKFTGSQIPHLSPAPTPKQPLAAASLIRRASNSVNELVKNFERKQDIRLPSPSKMPVRVETPSRKFASTSASVIPRPASPPPRMNLRSPTNQNRTIESVMKSPAPATVAPASKEKDRQRLLSPKHLAKRVEDHLTTTPPGSPPPLGGKSILEVLDLTKDHDGDDEMDEEEEEDDAVAVEQQLVGDKVLNRRGSSLAFDEREAEKEARLASLPRSMPASPGTVHGDDYEEEMVVERGRGALASAMDEGEVIPVIKTKVVKISPSKFVMPGTFGATEEDEEEDEDADGTQLVEDSQLPTRELNGKTIIKKISTASIASSNGSNASGPNGNGMMSFLSKPFGGGQPVRKGDAPKGVKSLQVAAALAKKEQADKERKAALKEEITQKKLAVAQKKQEEERQKADEEKRVRLEVIEKKRKEREEAAAKAAKMNRMKSKDDLKKPTTSARPLNTSQSNLNASIGRSGLNNSTNALNASTKSNGTSNNMVGVKYMAESVRVVGGPTSGIARPAGPNVVKLGQQKRPPQAVPAPRSEPEVYEELPDINSEYSESDDEGRASRIAALPDWTRSPHVRNALEAQRLVNPDDVFGIIPPLSMKEIFRGNTSRFSKRTSSACWEGVDALSEAEKVRYNVRMGYVATASTSTSTTTNIPR